MKDSSNALEMNKGLYIGAHMSIAGGPENAWTDAQKVNATALQIFVKNNKVWKGPAISKESVAAFKARRDEMGVHRRHVIAHSGYLINLSGTRPDVTAKSLMSLENELSRCLQLEVFGLVMHPGSHLKTSSEEGIERLARSIRAVMKRQEHNPTKILFETMVGSGSQVGHRFEELRDILEAVDLPDRTGVCLDTCHIFSAGYDIRTFDKYQSTMKEFDNIIGIERLGAIHLNDSQHGLGEKKDRHEHIGEGLIGPMGFSFLLNDERLAHLPMVLETPKGDNHELDIKNLDTIRSLIH